MSARERESDRMLKTPNTQTFPGLFQFHGKWMQIQRFEHQIFGTGIEKYLMKMQGH